MKFWIGFSSVFNSEILGFAVAIVALVFTGLRILVWFVDKFLIEQSGDNK